MASDATARTVAIGLCVNASTNALFFAGAGVLPGTKQAPVGAQILLGVADYTSNDAGMSESVEHALSEEHGNHLVQFYDAEPSALIRNVAGFIDEGLRRGDSVVVIAIPEHSDAFLTALGRSRRPRDVQTRRLVFLDAQATLDQFMLDGQPDWRRFEQVV